MSSHPPPPLHPTLAPFVLPKQHPWTSPSTIIPTKKHCRSQPKNILKRTAAKCAENLSFSSLKFPRRIWTTGVPRGGSKESLLRQFPSRNALRFSWPTFRLGLNTRWVPAKSKGNWYANAARNSGHLIGRGLSVLVEHGLRQAFKFPRAELMRAGFSLIRAFFLCV